MITASVQLSAISATATLPILVIDATATIPGVALYLDGADTAVNIESGGTATWIEKAIGAPVSDNINPPTYTSGGRGWDFTSNNQLKITNEVILSRSGFSLFFCFDRDVSSDTALLGTDPVTSSTAIPAVILIRATSILVNIATNNFSFTHTVGTGRKMMEIRYDGDLNFSLYMDKVFVQTVAQNAPDYTSLQQIGRIGTQTTQSFNGRISSICLFNDVNETNRLRIEDNLFRKFITFNMQADINAPFKRRVERVVQLMFGDSIAVGRANEVDIATGSLSYKTPVPNSLIYSILSSVDPDVEDWQPHFAGHAFSEAQAFAGDFGFLASFMIDKADAEGTAYTMNFGIGGTTLFDNWNKGDTLYDNMVVRLVYYLQRLKEIGVNGTIDYAIIVLGTNDAVILAKANAFAANLAQMIPDLRTDLSLPFLRCLLQKIQSGAFASTINTAIANEASTDANTDFSTNSDNWVLFDGVHPDADSCIDEGQDTYINHYLITSGIGFMMVGTTFIIG